MKREDISDALDMLDEEFIRHTALVRNAGENGSIKREERYRVENEGNSSSIKKGKERYRVGNRKSRNRIEKEEYENRMPDWKKWYALAAGLCLICIAAAAIAAVSWGSPSDYSSGLDELSGQIVQENPPKLQEPFVPVSSLLASRDLDEVSGAIKEMAAAYAKVPIEEYTGIYERIDHVDSSVLAGSTGRKVDGAGDWYYISGHLDLQYLIRKENQDYSLWEFHYFDSDEYPYSDVLKLVYRIDSADAIAEITVRPAKMDNTDEGERIQQQIGTHNIAGRDGITAIYQVLCTMTCYGSNRWDLIDYGAEDAAVDGEGGHRAVRLGRYLTLALDNGNTIDGLKYTAVSDMFYEFSGVAYNRLTEEQAESIAEILGISKPLGQPQNQGSVSNAQGTAQGDSFSDNSGKGVLYPAENTSASLEYVTELQAKVSSAMINHELPFVTESAVYENPYRLHVVVATDSAEELEKLKALDTEGGVLEIEYNRFGQFSNYVLE